ncbi:hypothetical protein [Micromonospora sp. NPDC049645]|uniref:preATP grasp domain-containing protein n=1 Tax=Micromonospora sp. NPDC049645 TaxID=3155508 RepID=UPI003439F9D8
MTIRPPRTFLANLINDVMIESAPPAYARKMAAVTPRKLWQARPGDCVVTLAPCAPDFREYVERITGVAVGSVDLVAPDRLALGHACDVIRDLGAQGRVASRTTLVPFVADRRAVAFARRTNMRLHPYHVLPGPRTLAAIDLINTKAGFRAVAEELGLPVAAGGHASTEPELVARLEPFVHRHGRAIVKVNRSSNGYGTFVVDAQRLEPVATQVRAAVADQPARACGWVYEQFLPFTAAPSVELTVDVTGPHEFYLCDQRTRDNAWTGMETPPARTVPAPVRAAAAQIGDWLAARGYRGYFDVDAGLVGDTFVVTEANVRRTGGTYLEELARRLMPDGPTRWRADARRGTTRLDFARAVRALDHAGLADPKAPARALLLVDTLELDGLWRYLVIGRSADAVAATEHELTHLLELT